MDLLIFMVIVAVILYLVYRQMKRDNDKPSL